ncbi:MAG: hypothetical protein A3D10_04040 [Omnitrophica WOR_2 bacterium RIFCSPHIGHO2_02_FULL_48_11]|nr:MAG: hypothetical protein A3D10_04040 [Omnitrophica WOR_2 bacterium RIFCSPHIGHO2_02_FULL_48_11]
MGFEINAANCFLKLKKDNANLSTVATIGRQNLHLSKEVLSKILREYDVDLSEAQLREMFADEYAENFLRSLGAREIDSFDYSDYEQCTVVHDMNIPIGEEYKNKYDVVFDGGSLEHVFNFPLAIQNCMEMVKVGGTFVAVTPCNNYSGHGFYQFSPELFFRIFSKENGFVVDSMYINDSTDLYAVADPDVVGSRVTFCNSGSTLVVVIAKRVEKKDIFGSLPQQGVYAALWNQNTAPKVIERTDRIASKIKKVLKHVLFPDKYDKKKFKKIQK